MSNSNPSSLDKSTIELQKPIETTSAPITPNPMLAEVLVGEFFLCSKEVINHFPNLEKSKPFKSGYDWDSEEYYVLFTNDYEKIATYYKEVIQPYNEKSNVDDIDFWIRQICNSQLNEAPKGCIIKCKTYGIFKAIENIWNLSNEKNRGFAIHKMSEYYGINPIEFINRVVV
jgi:hypothetical protein